MEPPDTVISPTAKLVVASLDVNVKVRAVTFETPPLLRVSWVIVIVGAVVSHDAPPFVPHIGDVIEPVFVSKLLGAFSILQTFQLERFCAKLEAF